MEGRPPELSVILVVDQDPVTLIGTAAVLHRYGYECVCARDVPAALKAVQTYPVDLVVMDLGGSTDETVETIEKLRQEAGNHELPAIVIAEAIWAGLEKRLESLERVRCLFKPVDPRVMGDLVQQLLWLPFLDSNTRSRGSRPQNQKSLPPGWVSL